MKERGTEGIEVGPGSETLEMLVHLLRRGIALGIGHCRRGGDRHPIGSLQLLAGTQVDKDHRALAVDHDIGGLQVEMPNPFGMQCLKSVEHLWQKTANLGFGQRTLLTVKACGKTFAIDEIHDIIRGVVVVEEVADLDHMPAVQLAYAAGLLAEFLAMGVERDAVFAQTDADLTRQSIAAANALHKKFLDSHPLVEGQISRHIGVAETA